MKGNLQNKVLKREQDISTGDSTGSSESNKFTKATRLGHTASTSAYGGGEFSVLDNPGPDHQNPEDTDDLTIFVGGLNSKCRATELQAYFSRFGKIASCEPQMWKKHQARCRGFALLRCANAQSYQKILGHETHFFQDRNIECKRFITSKDNLLHQNQLSIDKKILVACIPEYATNAQLRAAFESVGEVDISYIIYKTPKKCAFNKVFGYVTYKSKQARDEALKISNFLLAGEMVTCVEYSARFQHKEMEEGYLMNEELIKQFFVPQGFNILA